MAGQWDSCVVRTGGWRVRKGGGRDGGGNQPPPKEREDLEAMDGRW